MTHTRPRRGLTLVELLAVIAIIGLLVALLMPAIQSARETSRRNSCSNNLKQMAMASLSHLEQIGTFPSAGWNLQGFGRSDTGGLQEMAAGSWMFNLLSFLDEVNLRNVSTGQFACSRMPSVFACPTMPGWTVNEPTLPGGKYNVSSYAGCSGSIARSPGVWCTGSGQWVPSYSAGQTKWWDEIADPARTPVDQRERWWQQCWGYGHQVANNNSSYVNGVIAALGRVRAAHVRDGLSNTYLAGERAVQIPGNDITVRINTVSETFYDWTWGFQFGLIKFTTSPPEQFKAGFTAGNNFGSRHSSGFGMAFCDGSVRHIGYDISATVHTGLGTRLGGDASGPID